MDWHKFMEVIDRVVPMVAPLIPGGAAIAPITGLVIHAIGEAEHLKHDDGTPVSGAEKRAHMQAIVADGAQVESLIAPGHPVTPSAASEVAGQVADIAVGVAKLVEQAQNKPVVPVVPVPVPAGPLAVTTDDGNLPGVMPMPVAVPRQGAGFTLVPPSSAPADVPVDVSVPFVPVAVPTPGASLPGAPPVDKTS